MKDPSKPKLLLITKQLFAEAEHLISFGDDFPTMKATLFLDLAVEQMLNCLIIDFSDGSEASRDDMVWKTIWQEAVKAIKKEGTMERILHFKELKELHEVRNLVQHHGFKPGTADIAHLLIPVKKMISDCFAKCYGFKFEEFKIWDTVHNPDLRHLLQESENASTLGGYIFTLAGAHVVFKKITSAIRAKNKGFSFNQSFSSAFNTDPIIKEINFYLSSFGKKSICNSKLRANQLFEKKYIYNSNSRDNELNELANQLKYLMEKITEIMISGIRSEVNSLRDDAEIANLGVSMAETKRFREIISNYVVHESDDGDWVICELEERDKEGKKQYALFSLEYLSRLVLLAQEKYPEALDNITILKPLIEQPSWKEFIKAKDIN